MVPLQEHQRPAAVLVQQLLSPLLQGQLGLPLLLALHQDPTGGYGVHHGIHADRLGLAHVLCDNETRYQPGLHLHIGTEMAVKRTLLAVSPGGLVVAAEPPRGVGKHICGTVSRVLLASRPRLHSRTSSVGF